MAKYRQVHITYWQDPFVEELEPLEKYFYLYLMTNSKTMQCGCYEISFRLMQYETGLTKDQIEAYINLFQAENKIHFDYGTKEFLIVNWLKHNSYASPKVKACINKELVSIKSELFKQYIDGIVNKNMPIGRPLIDYTKTMDTSTQQEQEQEREQQQTEDISKLLKLYQQDIQQMPGKTVMDGLISYYEIFGYEMTEHCITISAKQGATKFAYLESIFKDWLTKGYETMDQINSLDKNKKPQEIKEPKFVAPWYKGEEDG